MLFGMDRGLGWLGFRIEGCKKTINYNLFIFGNLHFNDSTIFQIKLHRLFGNK